MSTFTFFSDIPTANQNPSLSQPQFLQNFTSIFNWCGNGAFTDHYTFGTGTDGQHRQITFPNITSQSAPSNPASILYTKNDAFTVPQLFFLNSQNNTYYSANTNGSTVLMGGIIMKWGFNSTASPVVFSVPFPHNCFSVVCTATTVQTVGVPSRDVNGFTFDTGGITNSFFWIAIGN